jgi:hypothetical protein
VSDDDVMRERKSRGNEEAHLAALFDYLESTGSEQVEKADEKEQRKRRFQDPQGFIFKFP